MDIFRAQPEWVKRAACRGAATHQFFLDESSSRHRVRDLRYEPVRTSYCSQCDVVPECLAYALDHDISAGLFGNMTPVQRWRLKRGRAI